MIILVTGIAFRRWIAYKMETDPFWQTGAEVVFSGEKIVHILMINVHSDFLLSFFILLLSRA